MRQVAGFEVTQVGLSSRSQQLDVVITNRNVGGPLGMSPLVVVEAKNWTQPVGTQEYALFIRKLQTRHGRAKLGYFVTTDRLLRAYAKKCCESRLAIHSRSFSTMRHFLARGVMAGR